ncbi:hypothetical protein [Parasitella parasitica]|uniref:Uncharacterized protein n=1 Tax=Parasitella parasitica TaxID=35722 RepID=A0A0B7NJG6_9FUNG|nr:hypothetical protein [Parasitella parasitica]
MSTMMMNDNDTKKTYVVGAGCVVAPSVNHNNNDKLVQQLLKKLDEGSETILNLRSLLTLKSAELNQLVHQLELIDQVLANVENGTEQMEIVLKDVLSSKNQQHKLVDAEATLDTAIKSACSLYSIDLYSVNNKQSPPIKTASIMNKIADILDELNIRSTLDLYKNGKSTLLKKRLPSSMDKIKQLGSNIRTQVRNYQIYTRNAPFMYGKEDIITILDREDHAIASTKLSHYNTLNKQQQQQPTEKSFRTSCSSTNTPAKKRQSCSLSSPTKLKSKSATNTPKSTLQMISRPTLTFMAKCREKKAMNNGPGSTLRLRNMLAKRNPSLKMVSEQMVIGSTVY